MSMQVVDRIYPHVPVWAQNVGISLYGLMYRKERLGGRFQEWVSDFQQRDRWSADQMQMFLQERLRQVLRHAFEQTPYYSRVWRDVGLGVNDLANFRLEDLRKLPTTPKEAVRRRPFDFVAQNVAREHKLLKYYTSGSTGTPVTCYCTADGHRSFIAAREVRSFGWAGASIRSRRSMIGGRLVVPQADSAPPYYRYNWAERQVYFSAFHISPSRISSYIRGFNRHRPELLTGYAYSHYALGRMMLESGARLDYEPKALVLSSEKLTPEMKQVIAAAFRARPYEEYGAVEQCVLATECEEGNLHANPDFGIVEILDDHGHSVPPGREGRIVCTSLLNDAQPLIRYEIGDIGAWSEGGCSCGRNHLPILKEVCGRIEDAVVCRDGRELVRFHGIFINLPNVIEAQVIQETIDRIRIKVVANEKFGYAEQNLIRERVAEQRLGSVHVEIEQVPAIERTERGKFRAVISHLPRHKTASAMVSAGE